MTVYEMFISFTYGIYICILSLMYKLTSLVVCYVVTLAVWRGFRYYG